MNRQRGFTLMEVLLATALASLAALASAGILRLGMDYYDRARHFLLESDEIRSGLRVARLEMAGVVGGQAQPFAGGAEEVEFTTNGFPKGAAIKGLRRVRLACRAEEDDRFLLTHQLIPPPRATGNSEQPPPSPTPSPAPTPVSSPSPYDEEVVLAGGLSRCGFEYLVVKDKKGQWQPKWDTKDGAPPLAVRLSLGSSRQDLPPVVLPIPRS